MQLQSAVPPRSPGQPKLAFGGVDIGAESIRELPDNIPLSVAKKTIQSDGYDQIIFEVNNQRYIASGDGLNFDGLKTSDLPPVPLTLVQRVTDAVTLNKRLQVDAPTKIEAKFLGENQTITLLNIDNEANTASEGLGLSMLAAGGTLAYTMVSGAASARFISGPPLKALSVTALNSQKFFPRISAKLTILQHDGVNWGARQFQKLPGMKSHPVLGCVLVLATIGVASLAVGATIGAVTAKMRGQDDEALMDMTREVSTTPSVVKGLAVGPSLADIAQSQK